MKKITEKHVGRLYFNKYTHMIQLEHLLFQKYEIRNLMRGYARKSTLAWSGYLQKRFDEMRETVNRNPMVLNGRGDFEREDPATPSAVWYMVKPKIMQEHIDSMQKLVDCLLQNRSTFDIGRVRMEHRRISFFSNTSAMQDELLKNFPEHVVCIGQPVSDAHKQALIEHAAEDSVMRKIVCKKRLKNDRYRFSIELKSMRDLVINNPGLFSMIKDLVEQKACLPNSNIQNIIQTKHTTIASTNMWSRVWYGTSRLWFEDDSSLGLLILGLGNTYIRCIEEYRVVA